MGRGTQSASICSVLCTTKKILSMAFLAPHCHWMKSTSRERQEILSSAVGALGQFVTCMDAGRVPNSNCSGARQLF